MRTSVQTNQMNTKFNCMSAHGITQKVELFFFFSSYVHLLFFHLIDYTKFVCFLLVNENRQNYVQGLRRGGLRRMSLHLRGSLPHHTSEMTLNRGGGGGPVTKEEGKGSSPRRTPSAKLESQMWLLPAEKRRQRHNM